MFGLIVPIIITIHVYRQAKETGRNAPLWAIINLAVIIGVQLLIGLSFGLAVAAGVELLNWDEGLLDKLSIPVSVGAVIVSYICSYFFVVRAVTRIPDQQFNTPPPPPPQFS